MTGLLQDVRYAARLTAKSPAIYLTLVLLLALGIGGATAMFTVVYGVLLRPLPFDQPDRLVIMTGASLVELDHWATAPSLESVAAWRAGGVNLTTGEDPRRVVTAAVTTKFFSVLRVSPAVGRTFAPGEQTPGRDRVALICYGLWQSAFAADPHVLHRVIHLDGLPFMILGVMPSRFSFPGRTDVWVPMNLKQPALTLGQAEEADLPLFLQGNVLSRLRDGATVEQGNRELKVLLEQLREKYAGTNRGVSDRIGATPLLGRYVRGHQTPLLVLLAAVGFLLLIACANAASLLLARAAVRQREVAVRLCLGATRGRILRQLLTESTLVSLVAGTLGSLVAYWLVASIRAFGPAQVPRLSEARVDLVALGCAVALSFAVGILVGLAPAVQAFVPDLTATLKVEGLRATGGLRQRLRRVLVVAEVALALVLLIGAGVMLRSLYNLLGVAPGFDPTHVVTMTIALPQTAAPSQGGVAVRTALLWQRVLNEVKQIPGVTDAGATADLPLTGTGGGLSVRVPDGSFHIWRTDCIEGDYFRAVGIPVLAGRAFSQQDQANSEKVMIVNRALARGVWGDGNPIGRTLLVEGEDSAREIVGVVGNVKVYGLAREDEPQFYLPFTQPFRGWNAPGDVVLVARTSADPDTLVAAVRKSVLASVPYATVFHERTLEAVVAESTAAPRFQGMVLVGFAGVALVLAVLGVYGTLAYLVVRRTHEIGVRMTLGARPADILRMVLGEGTRLALAGIAVGSLAAWWLGRSLATLLFGVSPSDPLTFAGAALLLFLAALCACLIPALRASRVDPARALHFE